jgi:integrase
VCSAGAPAHLLFFDQRLLITWLTETVRIWGRSSSRAPGDPSTPPGVDEVQSWQAPLIEANPIDKLDRVRLPSPVPHGLGSGQVEVILVVIPRGRLRDRVLFRLIAETGLHAAEAFSVHVEDLDLAPGDEYPRVLGKGGRPRPVLFSDVGFLAGTTGRPISGTLPWDAEGHAAR